VADSFRLTCRSVPTRPPLTIASNGEFAYRIAEFLSLSVTADQRMSEQMIADYGVRQAFDMTGGPLVLVCSRPEPSMCQLTDRLAFERDRTWLPIIVDHPVLQVGPLVMPPMGPCFTCAYRRRIQHETPHSMTAVISTAYEGDAEWGPSGYLPHHARLAAAVAHGWLAASTGKARSQFPLGRVLSIRMASSSMSVERVVPCYDCQWCNVNLHAKSEID
jgi:bacteriocin biosynthesis cyclodehydratase domain-containing protein